MGSEVVLALALGQAEFNIINQVNQVKLRPDKGLTG